MQLPNGMQRGDACLRSPVRVVCCVCLQFEFLECLFQHSEVDSRMLRLEDEHGSQSHRECAASAGLHALLTHRRHQRITRSGGRKIEGKEGA